MSLFRFCLKAKFYYSAKCVDAHSRLSPRGVCPPCYTTGSSFCNAAISIII